MTKQELLQAVYARIGGKPDFAPEPLILAKVQEAIKSVTKELVYSGNPMSSLLIDTESLSLSNEGLTPDTKLNFWAAETPEFSTKFLKILPKFSLVTWYPEEVGSLPETVEPANSWDALETLPDLHRKPYYKWHNNTLYVNVPTPIPAEGEEPEEETVLDVDVEHYAYLPLSEFPYELVDLLLNVLVPMILPTPPAEPPKKNAK